MEIALYAARHGTLENAAILVTRMALMGLGAQFKPRVSA